MTNELCFPKSYRRLGVRVPQLHSSWGGKTGLVEDDVYAVYTLHIIHTALDKQADIVTLPSICPCCSGWLLNAAQVWRTLYRARGREPVVESDNFHWGGQAGARVYFMVAQKLMSCQVVVFFFFCFSSCIVWQCQPVSRYFRSLLIHSLRQHWLLNQQQAYKRVIKNDNRL